MDLHLQSPTMGSALTMCSCFSWILTKVGSQILIIKAPNPTWSPSLPFPSLSHFFYIAGKEGCISSHSPKQISVPHMLVPHSTAILAPPLHLHPALPAPLLMGFLQSITEPRHSLTVLRQLSNWITLVPPASASCYSGRGRLTTSREVEQI